MKHFKLLISATLVFIIGAVSLFVYNNIYLENIRHAEEMGKVSEINVGLVSTSDGEIQRYSDLLGYMSDASGIKWKLAPLTDSGTLLNKFETGEIRAGFVGSAVAYSLIDHNFAIPLFRPEKGGVSTYQTVLIARKSLQAKKLDDLRGKRFAYADLYTSAGFMSVYSELEKRGFDPNNFFSVMTFTGSHQNVVKSVLSGEFDAGCLKSSVWDKMVSEDPSIAENIEVLSRFGYYPESTLVVDKQLERSVRWQELFNRLNGSESGREAVKNFGVDRMIMTSIKDFSDVAGISKYEKYE